MIEFTLKEKEADAFIELNKLLKAAQVCDSGSMANQVIVEGMVKVNSAVDTRKRAKIRRGDLIEFEGEQIKVF